MGPMVHSRLRDYSWRIPLIAIVVAVVATLACQRDQFTDPRKSPLSPGNRAAMLSRIDSARNVIPRKSPRLDEINTCFVINKRVRGQARFARDTVMLPAATSSAAPNATGVPFFYVEFDPATKKAIKQVYCTIPAGQEALTRALNEFTPHGAQEALRLKRDARRVAVSPNTRLPDLVANHGNETVVEMGENPLSYWQSDDSVAGLQSDLVHTDDIEGEATPSDAFRYDAAPTGIAIPSTVVPPSAGVFWYCWDGWDENELICDWGEGDEYCYYEVSDGWGDWYLCGDGCYIIDDGYEYWRWCDCGPGYYWDDWSWECYWDGVTFELDVSGSGAGDGSVYSDISGIECDITSGTTEGACSEYYASIDTVTLSASPWEGSTFSGWSGACSGSGDCQVPMSEARNVIASFQVQPTEFDLHCSAAGVNPSTSISVVRATVVTCTPVRTSGPSSATAEVTRWEFHPNSGSHTFGLDVVLNDEAPPQSWVGEVVVRGTVHADITHGVTSERKSAVITNVTMRTGFPAMTAGRLYEAPNHVTFHTPAQANQLFSAGKTEANLSDNADLNSVLETINDFGPNHRYQYTLDSFIFDKPTVSINADEFEPNSNLWVMAGMPWPPNPIASPPFTAIWCTRNWIANSMLAQTELHEGTTTQTDSHAWAHREYMTSTAVGANGIRERFEKFVVAEDFTIDETVYDYIISPINMQAYSNSHTHNAATMQQCTPLIR